MNPKNGSLLEVCHDADPEGTDPTKVQSDNVYLDWPLSHLVTDKKLVDLFVTDVNDDSNKECAKIEKLGKYTIFCREKRCKFLGQYFQSF